jgi:hypothetical protein
MHRADRGGHRICIGLYTVFVAYVDGVLMYSPILPTSLQVGSRQSLLMEKEFAPWSVRRLYISQTQLSRVWPGEAQGNSRRERYGLHDSRCFQHDLICILPGREAEAECQGAAPASYSFPPWGSCTRLLSASCSCRAPSVPPWTQRAPPLSTAQPGTPCQRTSFARSMASL